MNCGTPGRTPSRRSAFAIRLILLVLTLLLALTVWAAPASAYRCGPDATRVSNQRSTQADKNQCRPSGPRKRGNADPISFAFFIGIIAAVLLVPITVRRREDVPSE
jgi:hypothetical protein